MERVRPSVLTLVILISRSLPSGPDYKKRCRSMSSGCSPTSRNILEISTDIPMGCILKESTTLVSSGYRFGPDSKMSLSAVPEVVRAEASNTTLSLVEVFEAFGLGDSMLLLLVWTDPPRGQVRRDPVPHTP